MTIISHKLQLIFLRTRKTAGTSIQAWLMPHLGPEDIIAADPEFWPVALPFMSTPSPTTRFFLLERAFKRFVLSRIGFRHMWLHYHEQAATVRGIVGTDIWRRYRKVTVVRNPWDQMISQWRFQQRLVGRPFPLDEMLDAIEADDDKNPLFPRPNWPIYTIDDAVVADDVIRYEYLHDGLSALAADLGIPFDLPNLKVGTPGQRGLSEITNDQIERIARLRRNEIAAFGYTPQP